jgi:hypothetical protein
MTTAPMTENDNLNKDIIQWACKYLSSHGYTLKSNLPENMRNTPWSYVARFATSDGYIYLKHTPKLLALEAIVIQILHDQFYASVPEVITHNTELNCFLMKDAGTPLREILKKQFDEGLLCKAINQFTSLQLAVADHVDIFLDIGVPDWRLNKFPDLYHEVILQKDLLIVDGLSEMEIIGLEKLIPKISNLCKKLSSYSIKQTIVQPDFNDNNTLINDVSQDITIIDLGEISISHPFFSLLNCLQQIKKHHALTDVDDMYLRIKDACFINYMNFKSKEHFLDAFATAQILWLVYGILSQYRLMIACGKEKIISFQPGRLSNSLRELKAACIGD